MVTRSWHRCLREYGIEPSAPRQNSVLNPQSVKQLQERLGQLLPVARAEMESLYEQIAGSGFAVILADTQGAVLSTHHRSDAAAGIPARRIVLGRTVGRAP